jgi:hypothetical protein
MVCKASLLLSVMLAAGLLGPAPAPAQYAPATPVNPPAPPAAITPPQLHALVRFVQALPSEDVLTEATGTGLSFAQPGSATETRQFTFRTQGGSLRHTIVVPASGNGPILFKRFNGTERAMWVCDMDGNLLRAEVVTQGLIQLLDVKDARPFFDEAMQVWIERIPAAALGDAHAAKP